MGCASVVPKGNLVLGSINGNNTIELWRVRVVRVDFPKRNPNTIRLISTHYSPFSWGWGIQPVVEIRKRKERMTERGRLDQIDVSSLPLATLGLIGLAHNNLL